ncbi:MAG TPA: invasin domain 3-containing protein, partial [Candidatus Krumholzibacterium sp.]|nr:invasin domain 3-containing protein [Candidatus Krumholzibacterium sp.]
MRKTITALVLVALLAGVSIARPWKTPVIDGTITGDGLDWDSDDLVVDDPLGDTTWGPNDVDDLWVTWDADNLYIGLRYQVSNNAMLVLLDTRDGVGASDINGIDWYARNFNFPDSVRADIIIAGWDGGPPGVRRIIDNSQTEDLTPSCTIANQTKTDFFREMEVAIPWDVLYLGDPGAVDPGAKIRAVALIAGGDNWNGPDSAPDNPGMNGAGTATTLINYYTERIDADGDGAPDTFEGSISGTVTLGDPLDTETVPQVEIYYESNDALVDRITLPAGGGPYTFGRLRDDSYRVEAFAPGYARLKQGRLVITGQGSLSGIDIELTRAGKVTGNVAFVDGPGYAATVTPYDLATGLVAGEGAVEIPDTGGDFLLLLPEGDYEIITEARGYVSQIRLATVTGSDSTHVADIGLSAVRATRLVLTDGWGNDIESVSTTVSYPDSGIYFYASCVIEARDDEGRRDWYDVAGYLDRIDLRATKLNNLTEPRGDVRFWGFDGDEIIQITSMTMYDGRGLFLVSGDEIEVLRVFTESFEGGLTGRFKVGIRSAEPEFIEISASPREITADGVETVTVQARLLDISSNPVSLPGVPVSFSIAPGSTGSGSFAIPSSTTSADGTVSTTFTATGAGSINITAS